MNNVELNKKYIRENINEREQAQFYAYFSQLQDHQHFQTWTLEKTTQIVKNFRTHQTRLSDTKLKENIIQLTSVQNSPLNSKTNKQSHHVEAKVPSEGKYYTSLNLLEQIQEKNAIKLNQSNRKPELKEKEQNWMNIPNIPDFLNYNKSQPIKFNNNLFQNFDILISNPPLNPLVKSQVYQKKHQVQKKQAVNQNILLQKDTVKILPRMSLPVVADKKQNHRLAKKHHSELDSPGGEKSKFKGIQKDRLFKWKIHQKIKCKKIQEKTKNSKIQIKHHQMVHRIFLPDYAMYTMQVQPGNIICKRTYDDFVNLRNIFQSLYPWIKIPYLESGSWILQNDIAIIIKNKKHLEMFMKGLLQHPILSKIDIFTNFISIVQHKQLNKYFSQIEKQNSPKNLEDMLNQTGQLLINLSSQQYQLINELPKWQKIFSQYFDKYNDLLSNLSTQMETIHYSYSQLKKLSVEMQNILKQLTERNTQMQRQQDFQLFFKKQQSYYSKKFTETQNQISKLNKNLIPFVKYEKNNINEFKPFFQSTQKLTEKYIKRLENQPQSPSTVEQIKTIVTKNKFKADIWEESENIQFFKLQLGCLHSTLLEQTHLFSNRLIDNLRNIWCELFQGSAQGEKNSKLLSIKSLSY